MKIDKIDKIELKRLIKKGESKHVDFKLISYKETFINMFPLIKGNKNQKTAGFRLLKCPLKCRVYII